MKGNHVIGGWRAVFVKADSACAFYDAPSFGHYFQNRSLSFKLAATFLSVLLPCSQFKLLVSLHLFVGDLINKIVEAQSLARNTY